MLLLYVQSNMVPPLKKLVPAMASFSSCFSGELYFHWCSVTVGNLFSTYSQSLEQPGFIPDMKSWSARSPSPSELLGSIISALPQLAIPEPLHLVTYPGSKELLVPECAFDRQIKPLEPRSRYFFQHATALEFPPCQPNRSILGLASAFLILIFRCWL